MCMLMQKDHTHTLKILLSLSTIGGLWKHQNNPVCSLSARVFRMLKFDTIIVTIQRKKKMVAKVPCTILLGMAPLILIQAFIERCMPSPQCLSPMSVHVDRIVSDS